VTTHIYVDIIPMDEILNTENCLYKIYEEKEQVQASFLKFGNFHQERNSEPLEKYKIQPFSGSKVLLLWLFVDFLLFTQLLSIKTQVVYFLAGKQISKR
jgi:hypothetical protein